MEDLSLTSRPGLPDALRILHESYPREVWEDHRNFGMLTRFWLDRHVMFRRLLELLSSDTRLRLDGGLDQRTYLHHLRRFGGLLVVDLHGHHQIEDHHYFPKLGRIEPRMERGLNILDADHHLLDAQLDSFTMQANGGLSGDEPGPFLDALIDLECLLHRHLEDEEDLIVPILLKHGEDALEQVGSDDD